MPLLNECAPVVQFVIVTTLVAAVGYGLRLLNKVLHSRRQVRESRR